METIKKAILGSDNTKIRLGLIEVPCYVIEGGIRVISLGGMQKALGTPKTRGSLTYLTDSLSRNEIIKGELFNTLSNPLQFYKTTEKGKLSKTYGYDASILIDLCDSFMEAKKHRDLSGNILIMATQAEMIIRSVAKVGIVALIDEATGYQSIRSKTALQELLDKYLQHEFAIWAKRFPDEFYEEMFRLRGWNMNKINRIKKPGVVGTYTNDIIYSRVAPELVEELRTRNPKDDKGRTKARDHQLLTSSIGVPALEQHMYAVLGLMRASNTWDSFMRILDRSFPKKNAQMILNVDDDQ